MPKRKKETNEAKKEAFLIAFRECGVIGYACDASGNSRSFIDKQVRENEVFAERCREAAEIGVDELEKEARRRALSTSDTLLIFMLKSKRRDVFGDRLQVGIESSAVDKLVSGLLEILNRVIPRTCPGCKTNLNLHEPIAQALLEASTVKAKA